MHCYFVSTNKNKIKFIDTATGKKGTTKFTGVKSVIFVGPTQQDIEDNIHRIRKPKYAVQPSLFCVGKDIFSITDTFLYIGVRYQFKSVLMAFYIYFKTIYLFVF